MSPNTVTRNRRRGFSLIELIIVLSVIGGISLWLISTLNASKDKSKYQSCVANVTLLAQQMERYKAANDFYPTNLASTLDRAYGTTALPNCPGTYSPQAGGEYPTYTAISDGYHFTLYCSGANHNRYLGSTFAGYPQYSQIQMKTLPEGR